MFERGIEGWAVMERAVELVKAGESFVLATVVWRQGPSSGQKSSRAIVTANGEVHGWVGGACAEPVLVREAQKVLRDGQAKLIWLGQEAEFVGMHVPDGVLTIPMSCQSEGALQIYIEPMQAAPQLVVVGRSPMATTLAQLAEDLDWRVDLVDGSEFESLRVSADSLVIVATQGHGDEEVLEAALASTPRFVGLVASAKRGAVVRDFLADRGITREQLDQIKVPVGIDLGHTTHREVAVSILAELVQLRAAGALSRRPSPHTQLKVLAPVEVIDLVCGMTVTAEKANRPFEYEGTTYYFCAPGCRTSFEKDPTAYIAQEAKC